MQRLLIDEPVLGLATYLRDLGWELATVRPGTPDDDIVRQAKAGGYIVITPDRKLLSRCRMLGIECVDVGFEDLARRVSNTLTTRRG